MLIYEKNYLKFSTLLIIFELLLKKNIAWHVQTYRISPGPGPGTGWPPYLLVG